MKSSDNFLAGFPVVIPDPFRFEVINVLKSRTPVAEVIYSFLYRESVALSYIAKYSINIEKKKASQVQRIKFGVGLVG